MGQALFEITGKNLIESSSLELLPMPGMNGNETSIEIDESHPMGTPKIDDRHVKSEERPVRDVNKDSDEEVQKEG